jgi:hypothetical protein
VIRFALIFGSGGGADGVGDQARPDTGFLASLGSAIWRHARGIASLCHRPHFRRHVSRRSGPPGRDERQALRDTVVRYNAEGVSGLSNRPRTRPSRLTEGQQATLRALLLRGPDPERDGISSWTRADIAELIEAALYSNRHRADRACTLRLILA